jgi:VWFA-related protein
MRTRLTALLLSVSLTSPAALFSQGLSFNSSVNLILVDVNVRDRDGQPIRDLTAADFEVLENGKTQSIVTFAHEDITQSATRIVNSSTLSRLAEGGAGVPVGVTPAAAAADAATPADTRVDASQRPLTSVEVAGRRVWVLLFDTSSMQAEELQKAAAAAITWGEERMTTADLVAIASIGSTLEILSDFTNAPERVVSVLRAFAGTDSTATADVDASTMATDEAAAAGETAAETTVQELDSFNNDIRLRGIRTLCNGLLGLQQHKSILYFSSGMTRSGADNAIESRAAINACSRANTAINPVDARGLQALVAGGSARQGSRGGAAAFSGRGVAEQFARLAAQQETLQSLASDTGGTAFTDSNDFGEAFDRITTSVSSYYILGYESTNATRDGSFRRIQVRLRNRRDVRLTAREGYYADRDFAHTNRGDRESQLQEQLLMAIPATDVPLFVTSSYFRLANADACGLQLEFGSRMGGPRGRAAGPGGPGPAGFTPSCFYVHISVAVPGDAIPTSSANEVLDIRGFVRDERNQPFATIKQTLTVPAATRGSLATRQVLFQTGTTLPPGRYIARITVRENVTGAMGTFEASIVVPELSWSPVRMSSVVLSTQLQPGRPARRTLSPLVRENFEIVPNLTHVVSRGHNMYFYYEVYEPALNGAAPHLRTSLTFYRGRTKVYETAVIERTSVDAADRRAAIFEFEIDAATFKPGLYTCQVNVIDAVAGKFAFPRLEVYVRE